MGSFQYEWWHIKAHYGTGWCVWEIKAKSKENAIKQIKKEIAETNSPKNLEAPLWEYRDRLIEVEWDSLTLDRKGYQRLY